MGIVGYVTWQKRNEFISNEIEDFQKNQLAFITQVAQKVEFSFSKLLDDLYSLSQIPSVQFLERNTCLLNMMRVQKLNRKQVEAIFRADATGAIRYAYPSMECPVWGTQLDSVFEHCRLTGQSHLKVIRRNHDGTDYLVIAQPVYTVQGDVHLNPSNKFSGIIFFITPLMKLQSYFFDFSYFGNRGYPWIITPDKLLVSTGNSMHLGKRFNEFLPLELNAEDQRDILKVLGKMVDGQLGYDRYTYQVHQDIQDKYIKLTAFTPLHLPDQNWSIAVSNPLSDVLEPLSTRIAELRYYVLTLIAYIAVMAVLMIFLLRRNHKEQLNELIGKEDENSKIRQEWQVTFDTFESMVFLLDQHLSIIRANRAVAMLRRGYADMLIGANLAEILDEVADNPLELPVKEIIAGTSSFSCKVSCASLGKVLLLTIVPVKENAGYHVDLICYLNDISEMETLQTNYHRAQKMESIGLMAGGVAHDLNNILSGIVSYPELLLMKLPEKSEFRDPIQMILSSGKRAAAVVDDLLTVARGVASVKSTEDLNNIVNSYTRSPECSKLQSLHTGVQFLTRLAPELRTIECSPVHIQKCLMNLVANGAEAIEGNGQVVISTSNFFYSGSSDDAKKLNPGEYVRLMVSDTGKGISKKDQERIFEPFYSKKEMGRSGTGLGLAVVWNTMQDHNGIVDVSSDVNGTCFTLYFKASSSVESEHLQYFDHQEIMGHGERILVVDDQELQRDIARQMLASLGYEVTSVQSGEESLVYLEKNPVDLVLLDMIMDPGMNGCETYEKILHINPNQKAIIVSGFSEDVFVKRALLLGAGALVKKPYTLEQIGAVVKSILVNGNEPIPRTQLADLNSR